MKCGAESGIVFEVGSLYAHFQGLQDTRKSIGVRYPLALVLPLIVLAKICGEDRSSGIAEWATLHGDAGRMANAEKEKYVASQHLSVPSGKGDACGGVGTSSTGLSEREEILWQTSSGEH